MRDILDQLKRDGWSLYGLVDPDEYGLPNRYYWPEGMNMGAALPDRPDWIVTMEGVRER